MTFTTPGGNGGFAITSYTATSNPSGVTGTCANSPCTVMGLTNGTAYTFTVTATNAAGTGAASAASNSVTPMAPQIITFANPGTQTFGTSPTLTASASSGLAVSFSSSTTGVCTITTGGTLTFVTTGNCDISVGQTGNGAYTAAPTVTQSFTVNAASQTITFGAAPTIVFGASGMVTATGGGSNNPIVFTSTTTGVCTIAGNVVTGVSVGACIIAANQANSANYAAAPQVTLSFNISASVPGTPTIGTATAGNTQATVSFTTPGSNGGSAITGYTATSSPSGVTGTCANSPCTVMGLTNSTAYTFTVTATNIAGTGGASAASNSVTPKSPQTIIFANPGTQTFGTSPTLTASASSGLAVSFSSSLFIPNYCTITTGGTLTFLGAGGCAIRADQAGNGVYTAASTVQQNFYIEPASQTITFGAAPNVVVGGTGMVSATGGGSNNPIVFWSVFSNICTVEGTVVTGVAVGTCLIVANQAYSANYAAATQVPLFFNIDAASQNITFGAAPTVFVGGTGMVTATGGGSNNPIVFTSTTTGICTIAGNVVTGVSVGGCIIAANQASSVNYVAAPQATLSFNIDPPPIAFTGNAYSRKTHGNGIGVQDLPLLNAPINGAFTVEPRIAGSGHQIVFRFTNTVTSVTGVSITDASSVAVGNPVIGFFGNDLVLTLGGIGDMTRVTVSVTGVNGFVGLNASRTVGFLVGDMNGSRAVTAADIAGIKSRKGITIDNSNFQFDINLSGAIDNADVSVAKARSAQVLP